MRNLETDTRLNATETMDKLKKFFGPGGLGLELSDEDGSSLTFSGGGGYVRATVEDCGDRTTVNLVSQEWEVHLDKFAASLTRAK